MVVGTALEPLVAERAAAASGRPLSLDSTRPHAPCMGWTRRFRPGSLRLSCLCGDYALVAAALDGAGKAVAMDAHNIDTPTRHGLGGAADGTVARLDNSRRSAACGGTASLVAW